MKMLQVKRGGVWVDYMPVIGGRYELARMEIEKRLKERTRWRPDAAPKPLKDLPEIS